MKVKLLKLVRKALREPSVFHQAYRFYSLYFSESDACFLVENDFDFHYNFGSYKPISKSLIHF